MAEEQQGQDPQFDINQVNEYIAQQVQQNLAAIRSAEQQQQPRQQQPDQVAMERQVREVLDPIYGPDINAAVFNSADAKDYVDFYTDDIRREYKDDVEAAFQRAKAEGRPTTRHTIYRYLLGNEYATDPDKFSDKQKQLRQKQLDRANSAADVGGSGSSRERAEIARLEDIGKLDSNGKFAMPLDDMAKALEGIAF